MPPNEFNQVTKVSLDLGRGVAFEYIVCSNMHNDRVTLWILKHKMREYVSHCVDGPATVIAGDCVRQTDSPY